MPSLPGLWLPQGQRPQKQQKGWMAMFNAQEITISPHLLEHRKLAQHRAGGAVSNGPTKVVLC